MTDLEILFEKYNANKEGLIAESYCPGTNTTYLFLSGRINGKLWVRAYERQSKKKLFEWEGSEILPTEIGVDKGYGEFVNYAVSSYQLVRGYFKEGEWSFLLFARGKLESIENYLYSKSLNGDVKKEKVELFINELYSWHEDSFIITGARHFYIYKFSGELLYSSESSYSFSEVETINYEESISFSKDDYMFSRVNYKSNETVWSFVSPLKDISGNPRVDSWSISKAGLFWTYTIKYTLYSGEKGELKVKINIESGEYEMVN